MCRTFPCRYKDKFGKVEWSHKVAKSYYIRAWLSPCFKKHIFFSFWSIFLSHFYLPSKAKFRLLSQRRRQRRRRRRKRRRKERKRKSSIWVITIPPISSTVPFSTCWMAQLYTPGNLSHTSFILVSPSKSAAKVLRMGVWYKIYTHRQSDLCAVEDWALLMCFDYNASCEGHAAPAWLQVKSA